MDPNSTLLCRLCLKQREDVVNVFDIFQNVTIDFILKQYFWLQVSRNEGLSEFLCQICWNNTKTFHIFYEEVELLQEVYWNSIGTAETNCYVEMIKEEPIETEINFDLNYVKNEDLKVEAEVIATEMNEEGSGNVASCKQVEIDAIPTKDVEKVKLPGRRRTKNGLEANNKIKVKKDKKENSQNSYEYRVNNDYLDAQLHVYFDMKCDICGDPFETYRSAQKHYRTAHNMKGYLICCGHKHHRRGRVLDHIQFHLNPSIFSCDQCSRKFATKKALTVHLEYHEPLSSRPFKCDLCPRSFPRETALNVHKDFLHCPVKCVECDMSYPSKSRLSTHMKNAHQPKVNATRVCDICAKFDLDNKWRKVGSTYSNEKTSSDLDSDSESCPDLDSQNSLPKQSTSTEEPLVVGAEANLLAASGIDKSKLKLNVIFLAAIKRDPFIVATTKKRNFVPKWCTDFPWLSYNEHRWSNMFNVH
ncbi:Zinc finger protein [Pseudolycoriella hygida]|uniref:Zinc finger protein n=1 Tax=Pseudolycoriella hygida TaxID=35572 RepID=A0A9Q0N5W4_9DIPT|nr:Zinc finger protein [Pseudolycoriella hygida]